MKRRYFAQLLTYSVAQQSADLRIFLIHQLQSLFFLICREKTQIRLRNTQIGCYANARYGNHHTAKHAAHVLLKHNAQLALNQRAHFF